MDRDPERSNDASPKENERDILIERCDRRRRIAVIHTGEPWAVMWRELRRFGAPSTAKQSLLKLDPSGKSAASLANCVKLADAYFGSYEDADEIIDPVLLYYGCMWLAHALIYANLTRTELQQRRREHHGVERSDQSGASLLDWKVRVVEGTACTFIKVLGGDDAEGQTYSLTSLLCSLPELDFHLRAVVGRGTSAIPLFTQSMDSDDVVLRVLHKSKKTTLAGMLLDENPDEDFLEREVAVYRCLAKREVSIGLHDRRLVWTYPHVEQEDLSLLCIETPRGYFLQRNFEDGRYIPELAIHLLILHAISEMARYQPDRWVSLNDNYPRDYALIREFISLSERKFPHLILNEFSNTHYIFQPPNFRVDPYADWVGGRSSEVESEPPVSEN